MKATLVAAAILALAAPAAAQAADFSRDGQIIRIKDNGKHKGHYKKGRGRDDRWDDRRWDDRRDEQRAYRQGYHQGQRDARYHGYGQAYYEPRAVRYGYQRGYYLPQQHRGYVIRDYDRYDDLYHPAYGQQWVGVGQNAYLMEVATGLILQVLGGYR